MQISYRQAHPEQYNLGLQLLKEAVIAIRIIGLDQWSIWLDHTDEQKIWVEDGFNNQEFYFIENTGGGNVGMLRLSNQDLLYWGAMEENVLYLHSLIIKQEFSGKQLGEKVISLIEASLVKQGNQLLRLDCKASNQWLCAYYERLGFVKVGQVQMPHALNNLYEKRLG